MAAGGCVMQRRPASFVDIGVQRNQARADIAHAGQRRQHQGALILGVAHFGPDACRLEQHANHLWRRLADGQQQGWQSAGAHGVDVKAARNQLADFGVFVMRDSLKKILIGARTRSRKSNKNNEIRNVSHVIKEVFHAATPENNRVKFALVTAATSSTLQPRSVAICCATKGT